MFSSVAHVQRLFKLTSLSVWLLLELLLWHNYRTQGMNAAAAAHFPFPLMLNSLVSEEVNHSSGIYPLSSGVMVTS